MDLFNVKFFTNIEQYKYNMAIKNKIYFYSFHYYQNNIIHQVLVIFQFNKFNV